MGTVSNRPAPDRYRSLMTALNNAGIFVVYFQTDLRVVWAENVPRAWSAELIQGRLVSDFVPADVADELSRVKQDIVGSGLSRALEIYLPVDGQRWFSVWMNFRPVSDRQGSRHCDDRRRHHGAEATRAGIANPVEGGCAPLQESARDHPEHRHADGPVLRNSRRLPFAFPGSASIAGINPGSGDVIGLAWCCPARTRSGAGRPLHRRS